MTIITVSQINTYIKALLDESLPLKNIFITGEISNFKKHFPSGHLYFTLKDEKSQLKAVMFKTSALRLKFDPDNGMKVICRGRISVFERNGEYQIYVEDMQPDGLGSLNLAFEQLKLKLFNEGLFDEKYKKSLPKYPQKIGIATSSTGAVFHDIQDITKRRYPLCELVLAPTLVQGADAAPDIVKSIKLLDSIEDIDIIIVGRGGGSIEDLWAFNTEEVAKAVFECNKPIISAVGHETDTTICDFVADLRSPTPSAAAELAVPDMKDIKTFLRNVNYTLESSLVRRLDYEKQRLDDICENSIISSPSQFFEHKKDALENVISIISEEYNKIIYDKRNELSLNAGKLDALSPLSVLARGYSIILKNNALIKSANNINVGDNIEAKLSDGLIKCTVNEVKYE